MQSILVKDYMNQNANAIMVNATVSDVVKFLNKKGVMGAPVVDSNHHLVGFVSEQDCLRELLNETFYDESPKSVTEVMVTNVSTVTPETSIVEVAENMSKGPPKNYPVIEEEKLVGIITRSSVLQALIDYNEGNYFHPES